MRSMNTQELALGMLLPVHMMQPNWSRSCLQHAPHSARNVWSQEDDTHISAEASGDIMESNIDSHLCKAPSGAFEQVKVDNFKTVSGAASQNVGGADRIASDVHIYKKISTDHLQESSTSAHPIRS